MVRLLHQNSVVKSTMNEESSIWIKCPAKQFCWANEIEESIQWTMNNWENRQIKLLDRKINFYTKSNFPHLNGQVGSAEELNLHKKNFMVWARWSADKGSTVQWKLMRTSNDQLCLRVEKCNRSVKLKKIISITNFAFLTWMVRLVRRNSSIWLKITLVYGN